MKILEVNFAKTWRGGERQTFYTAGGLMNLGNEVTIACYPSGKLFEHAKEHHIKTVTFSRPLRFAWWLMKHGSAFNIIHCQGSKELTWVALTKRFHRAKIVLTRRVNFTPKGLPTYLKYKQADKIVGISRSVQITIEKFGFPDVSIIPDIYVPSKADRTAIKNLTDRFGLSGKKIIATTSALTEEKDPFTMVECIGKLRQKRNDFLFIHFGDGDLRPALEKRITELALTDCYLLAGHYNNVEGLFPVFDLFMMSSSQEGLGSSVLDAFYHRIPVVSTDAGGLADLLSSGRGHLCAVKDAQCLSEGADQTLSALDGTEIKAQLDAAYDHLTACHEMEQCSKQYQELFTLLLTSKR